MHKYWITFVSLNQKRQTNMIQAKGEKGKEVHVYLDTIGEDSNERESIY